jgi:zona occludens toxin
VALSIHHGAPGSYKSFCLVQRFGFDALVTGRTIVTNIRGFHDLENIKKHFPDLKIHPDSSIIFVTSDSKKGRQLMAGFFHWVPFNCLLLIDEGQRVYPKRKGFTLESLDRYVCPDGYTPSQLPPNAEFPDGIPRPEDALTAFDMQRHFQWDIYISTPHINKILDPIREVAVTSFYHTSLAEKLPLFFKNTWYEHKHDPSNAGHSPFQRIGAPTKYKADLKIFNCYQSTATGEYTESKADKSILSDSTLRLKMFFVVVGLASGIYFGIKAFNRHSSPPPIESSIVTNHDNLSSPASTGSSSAQTVVSSVSKPGTIKTSDLVVNHDNYYQTSNLYVNLGFKPVLIASQSHNLKTSNLKFYIKNNSGLRIVDYQYLINSGFYASIHSHCNITLIHSTGQTLDVGCSHPSIANCAIVINTPDKIINHDCSLFEAPVTVSMSTPKPMITASQIITKQGL